MPSVRAEWGDVAVEHPQRTKIQADLTLTTSSIPWLRSHSGTAFVGEFQQRLVISGLADVHEK
ncbi:hypothetical protein [Streptomyces sp. NPDC056663]|uniref:hypothetical protein n=1 Tax=Streptomyces sp. NPDC056663 TaxID=3345899 RepID=UPI0036CBF7D2